MRFAFTLSALALLGLAAPAAAQGGSIRAGMSPEQVRAAFGAPARTRDQGDWTYWFYDNGCPVRCGSDDVVFLQDGKVVAAVLRTGRRRFDGPAAPNALASIEGLPPTEQGLVRVPYDRPVRARIHRRPAAARASTTRTTSASRTTTRTTAAASPSTAGTARAPGTGPVRMRVIRTTPPAGQAQTSGRTVITGQPTTIVGTGGAGATVGGVTVRRGSRAAGDSAGPTVRTTSDSSVDQARLDREKRVTPRVMPAPAPGIHP